MTKQRAMAAEAELAFDAFVAHRGRALARTAYLLTGDHHLAEDLVQTTLFKTAKAWHRIEGDPEPYVRRALYHEHISSWLARRNRRRGHQVKGLCQDSPPHSGIKADVHPRALQYALVKGDA